MLHLRAGGAGNAGFDGSYDVCLVSVTTDEGLAGVGETESLSPAVRAIVDGPGAHSRARALREVLVGRDPLDPEALWRDMYEATELIGRRGLVMHAIGGVDLALWDLRGKVEGRPVCELLGTPVRERVPAYGTIYRLGSNPEQARRQVESALARNLVHVKVCAESWWLDDLGRTAELLAAVRDALGDGRLLVDAALSYRTLAEGLRLLPLLEAAGVWLLEAPLPLDDLTGHVELAGRGIPLGVGDLGLTHVDEFVSFMDAGACDVCQPDVSCVGGLTGLRRVAEAARARGRLVVPHGYKTNVLVAANAQFLACEPGDVLLEYSLSTSPLRWETTVERLDPEPDGAVLVPSRPGLGISLDEATVARYRVD